MSNNFQQSNLGEQFKKAVSEGLASGDFKELNILVNDTVSEVISEAGRQVKTAANNTYRNTSDIYESTKEYEEQQKKQKERYKQQYKQYKQHYKHYEKNDTPTEQSHLSVSKTKNVGQVSSLLYMVTGGIGMTVAAGLGVAAFILSFINTSIASPFWISFGLLFGASVLLLHKGTDEKKRLNRMKRYLTLFSGKMYINLSDIAQSTGKSTKYILKDVKKMLARGFFPEGHLDQKETCLMLDDATYREYLRLEKERNAYEKETAGTAPKSNVSSTDGQKQSASNNSELMTMMREGKAYIQKLHELNELIPGEIISEKLYRMEGLLKEIFERLEDDPSQMSQLHKLMNYYLPTTIKLLQSYSEFDNISTPGSDVILAKEEIEKTVDIINEAFAELLNKLFQTSVFDATTDAQVLQTMLAKEGLTKNDFS